MADAQTPQRPDYYKKFDLSLRIELLKIEHSNDPSKLEEKVHVIVEGTINHPELRELTGGFYSGSLKYKDLADIASIPSVSLIHMEKQKHLIE